MKKEKTKKFTLRAYKIVNDVIGAKQSDIIEKFNEALKLKSVAKNRLRQLNEKDENSESDLLSFHLYQRSGVVKGLIIRTMQAVETKNISVQDLDKTDFIISELQNLNEIDSSIIKDSYYFCMNNSFIVTNLSTSISRFQTYINWLLEDVRGDKLYEFIPHIAHREIKFSEIKQIRISDEDIYKNLLNENIKQFNISTSILKILGLNDVPIIDDLKGKSILTAKIILGFTKPRKMKEEDYERMLSASLKPIENSDDIVFVTKKGLTYKGSNLLCVENVVISLTEKGLIDEQELLQALESFLKSIK